jgi:hypothetical protein
LSFDEEFWIRATRGLRGVEDAPEARARIMGAVRRLDPPRRRSLWERIHEGWLVPRPVRLSPVVVAAALALALLVGRWLGSSPAPDDGGFMTGETRRPVQFVLAAPEASTVSVVGDFNDWDPAVHRMARDAGGPWSIVIPLEPGRHTYAFVVDESVWMADTDAPRSPEDEFGRVNSVVMVEKETI